MCLALLWKCKGLFKGHADGIDTGEYSTIDLPDVFSLLSRECTEERGYAGNTERSGEP